MVEGKRLQDIRFKGQSQEERVFGDQCPRHAVTGMPLQQGSGAWPADKQARELHIPYIRQTQGDNVAERMLLEMDLRDRENAKAWDEWRKKEAAKILDAKQGDA